SHTLTALAALSIRRLPVPAIVVSDSASEHPSPFEIISALAEFAPGTAVFHAPRGPSWDAGALAEHLVKGLALV
ncbi:MAG: ATP-dependent dethiobiotin synthetase BioD, partial [Alphaproteobacteria bacterium]